MGPCKLFAWTNFKGILNQINTVFQNLSTLLPLRSQWREEQVEMWMWGCKMIRTARSWIRICRHHMVSEASVPRFVFRTRASPARRTECVKMQFHTFVHPPTAACQRIGPVVLHTLWNHGENLSESFVMPLFVRSTVWSSVLVLNMRYPASAAAHKSWPSWLCSRNPSPPPRREAALRCWENQVMWDENLPGRWRTPWKNSVFSKRPKALEKDGLISPY
jgi:hypothetical protein